VFHIEAGRVGFVYHDVVDSHWFKKSNGNWEREEFAKRCLKNLPMLVMVDSSRFCSGDPSPHPAVEILIVSQVANPNIYWAIPEDTLKPYVPWEKYV
jgi:hypothetical protein